MAKRKQNEKHLAFIRTLKCVGCNGTKKNEFGDPIRTQAAHIRRGTDGGVGMKPSSCYTVPLCQSCHYEQHLHGELTYWYTYGGYERAIVLAKKLYEDTGDISKATRHIIWFRKCKDRNDNESISNISK